MTVHITYLVSHSSSLSCHTVIKGYFWVGCIMNTKLPSYVDIIHCTSLSFPSWCPESTRPMDSCFQGTSWENLMMYGGLCQHTRVVCICIIHFDQSVNDYYTPPKVGYIVISFICLSVCLSIYPCLCPSYVTQYLKRNYLIKF